MIITVEAHEKLLNKAVNGIWVVAITIGLLLGIAVGGSISIMFTLQSTKSQLNDIELRSQELSSREKALVDELMKIRHNK